MEKLEFKGVECLKINIAKILKFIKMKLTKCQLYQEIVYAIVIKLQKI